MSNLKDYIMNIVTVSLICSLFIHMTKSIKPVGHITRMLCGILIALTVFSPILQLRWNEVTGYLDRIKEDAQTNVSAGTQITFQQKNDSIQQQVQAYILDKASHYDCVLDVKVELSGQDPPVPIAVEILGAVSPYQKAQLSEVIAADLGIPKEMQTWNAVN